MQFRMRACVPILILCLILIFGGFMAWQLNQGGDPYNLRYISADQIAEVTIFSPDARMLEMNLNNEEVQKLVDYLNRVNLFGQGSQDFKNCDGGYPFSEFRITRVDGTTFTFNSVSPFYILDLEFGYNTFHSDLGYTEEDIDLCSEIGEFRKELNVKYYGKPW